MFFLEKYKIRKIKQINYGFENYLKKMKRIEKIIFFFKKIYLTLNFLKYKKFNDRIYFFKKYYKDFINEQKNFI